MPAAHSPPSGFKGHLRLVGPGLVVAATGVGAGDLVAAAKAGALYGMPLLWTAVIGAVIKFVHAEGVGRWQLATGTTVLEGWVRLFGLPVRIYFFVYLLLWTFIVSAALIASWLVPRRCCMAITIVIATDDLSPAGLVSPKGAWSRTSVTIPARASRTPSAWHALSHLSWGQPGLQTRAGSGSPDRCSGRNTRLGIA